MIIAIVMFNVRQVFYTFNCTFLTRLLLQSTEYISSKMRCSHRTHILRTTRLPMCVYLRGSNVVKMLSKCRSDITLCRRLRFTTIIYYHNKIKNLYTHTQVLVANPTRVLMCIIAPLHIYILVCVCVCTFYVFYSVITERVL